MPNYIIPNLRNACEVIAFLARRQRPREIRSSEIARQLNLPRTTTKRILTTLEAEGVVTETPDGFHLGPTLIGWGASAQEAIEVRDIARPYLERIAQQTRETCHLAIPFQRQSLIVEVEQSSHPLTATSHSGNRVDIHCSATGKVFLAYLHEVDLESFIKEEELVSHTANTIVTYSRLREEMRSIRAQGYAIDEEEYYLGVRCIAAPVVDHTKTLVAAVGLTSSIHRFPSARTEEVAAILRDATLAISRRMGAR